MSSSKDSGSAVTPPRRPYLLRAMHQWMSDAITPVEQGEVVAKIGKIGIKADAYRLINEARTRIAQHPAWTAKAEDENRADAVDAEYETLVARVDAAMTLNGKSY